MSEIIIPTIQERNAFEDFESSFKKYDKIKMNKILSNTLISNETKIKIILKHNDAILYLPPCLYENIIGKMISSDCSYDIVKKCLNILLNDERSLELLNKSHPMLLSYISFYLENNKIKGSISF